MTKNKKSLEIFLELFHSSNKSNRLGLGLPKRYGNFTQQRALVPLVLQLCLVYFHKHSYSSLCYFINIMCIFISIMSNRQMTSSVLCETISDSISCNISRIPSVRVPISYNVSRIRNRCSQSPVNLILMSIKAHSLYVEALGYHRYAYEWLFTHLGSISSFTCDCFLYIKP